MFKPKNRKKKKNELAFIISNLKIKEKIPKPSSAIEEIGLKNLYSNDEWLAKGVNQKMIVRILMKIMK